MGQSFVFFNIDKRQSWCGGKFGELFPEGRREFTSKLLGRSEIKLPIDPLQGHPYVKAEKINTQKLVVSHRSRILHVNDSLITLESACAISR